MSDIRYPSVEKPWLKMYGEECCKSQIPKQTLYEHMTSGNKDRKDANALIYFDNYINFGTLFEQIDKAAAAFAAMGIKKGDVVAYCTLSSPESVFCLYALNKLGAAMMVLDPRRSAEEIQRYVKNAGIKYLLLMNVFYENLKPVLHEMGLEKAIVVPINRSAGTVMKIAISLKFRKLKPAYDDTVISYEDFLAYGKGRETQMVGFDEFDVAAITFSGGTTGMPKGVMLTNYSINAITDCMRNSKIALGKHRYLTIIPIFSSYGLVCGIHMPLCMNTTEVLLIAKPEPEKLGKIFKKYQPNHTMMVPGYYEKLIDSKEMADPNVDLSGLITVGVGGDTVSEGLEQRVNEFLALRGCKQRLAQGYGMSELSSATTACCKGFFKEKSVGFPLLHTQLSIFEPGTDRELTYNQVGEICATGPTMMKGYFNDPEETDKIMIPHSDGLKWIHTGDLGYMDEEGFVFICGRMKRAIPRPDGHKVFPVEIENSVSKAKNVVSCAVVGAKCEKYDSGEFPVAAICLKDRSLVQETIDEVNAICEKELDIRARPKDVFVLEEMPYIGMGKIDYNKVAADYIEKYGELKIED